MIKKFTCIILSICLIGCTTSPTIWSIGANSISGKAETSLEIESIEVPLVNSELVAHEDAGFLMPGYPYQSLEPKSQNAIGKGSVLLNDIKWKNEKNRRNSQKGIVTIDVNGVPKEFAVLKIGNQLWLKHYYRNWYGYPAQGMLLVTYPLDFVIVVLGGIAHVLLMPFTSLANSNTGNNNLKAE